MIKKGYTLIEVMVSLFIFFIIISLTLEFISFSMGLNMDLKGRSSDLINATIAIDFIQDKIRTGNIEPINNYNKDRLEILKTFDGSILYLKNGILRYSTDSQQITPNIDYVFVEKISNNLFKISVTTSMGKNYICYVGGGL